jgi:hypothetical protein
VRVLDLDALLSASGQDGTSAAAEPDELADVAAPWGSGPWSAARRPALNLDDPR